MNMDEVNQQRQAFHEQSLREAMKSVRASWDTAKKDNEMYLTSDPRDRANGVRLTGRLALASNPAFGVNMGVIQTRPLEGGSVQTLKTDKEARHQLQKLLKARGEQDEMIRNSSVDATPAQQGKQLLQSQSGFTNIMVVLSGIQDQMDDKIMGIDQIQALQQFVNMLSNALPNLSNYEMEQVDTKLDVILTALEEASQDREFYKSKKNVIQNLKRNVEKSKRILKDFSQYQTRPVVEKQQLASNIAQKELVEAEPAEAKPKRRNLSSYISAVSKQTGEPYRDVMARYKQEDAGLRQGYADFKRGR